MTSGIWQASHYQFLCHWYDFRHLTGQPYQFSHLFTGMTSGIWQASHNQFSHHWYDFRHLTGQPYQFSHLFTGMTSGIWQASHYQFSHHWYDLTIEMFPSLKADTPRPPWHYMHTWLASSVSLLHMFVCPLLHLDVHLTSHCCTCICSGTQC